MTLDHSRVPVLVACGQFTEHDRTGRGMVPPQLIAQACQIAGQDSESTDLLSAVGHVAVAGLTIDADVVNIPISRGYKNLPKSVANLLDITPKRFTYVAPGGNTPQYLVNHFAEQIALGHEETVLITGGESLATMLARFDRWYKWLMPKSEWRDDPGGIPESLGDTRPGCTPHEAKHGLELPANVYPLFENALQHKYQRSQSDHLAAVGALFARFTKVAAANPYAWFQTERSAEDLITHTSQNRMVAFPYTKQMNSMIGVNQAAAVIMTSLEKARSLGIAVEKMVFLHGCADANDHWNLLERVNFHSSPAMHRCAQEALKMAGKSINDIAHFDLYSCFPSAVQVACDEFGLSHDDSRGLTLTGGLPYFGGPGNNYSLHGIAELMQRLRANPGDFGLLNANGWYLTKHALGVYSTQPLESAWERADKTVYQAELLAQPATNFTESPAGKATIETFTVVHDRSGKPKQGIIIGRQEDGLRFVANTPKDRGMMHSLCVGNAIGRVGEVASRSGKNTFRLV